MIKSLAHSILAGCLLLSLSACTTTSSGRCPLARCAAKKVERHCWVTGLRPEKAAYYKFLHAHPDPAVNKTIKACQIRNFSVYTRQIEGKTYLIAYLEYTGKDFNADMKKMAADPATISWWKKTDPCQIPLPEAKAKGKIWSETVEVYHLD